MPPPNAPEGFTDGQGGEEARDQKDGAAPKTKAVTELENTRPPKQSKAAKKAAKTVKGTFEEVNVLVTGFGLFDDLRDSNPSWLIARSLPPDLTTNALHPSRIRIIVYSEPVLVSYATIDRLTEENYGVSAPVHLILHIGVGERRDYYSVEKFGQRDGYDTKDVNGELPTNGQPQYWGTSDSRLTTTAALRDVLPRWRGVVEGQDLRISEDAGQFICDYQFYSSLARVAQVQKSDPELSWKDRTMVSFMHVPIANDDNGVDKGREIAIGLIYALIDSRRSRDGDYDEDGNLMEAPNL